MKDASFHLSTDLSSSLIKGVLSHHIDTPITAVTAEHMECTFILLCLELVVNKNCSLFQLTAPQAGHQPAVTIT